MGFTENSVLISVVNSFLLLYKKRKNIDFLKKILPIPNFKGVCKGLKCSLHTIHCKGYLYLSFLENTSKYSCLKRYFFSFWKNKMYFFGSKKITKTVTKISIKFVKMTDNLKEYSYQLLIQIVNWLKKKVLCLMS